MSRSWLRQLLKKRFVGQGACAPIQPALTVEALEDRALMAVAVWTGGGIPAPTGGNLSALWSNSLNWQLGNIPQDGDDVIFPAGLAAANKPPAAIVNGAFIFPNGAHNPPPTPPAVGIDGGKLANSIIDDNPFHSFATRKNWIIGNLQINDDNYHIDALTAGTTLTILGRVTANIPQTVGSLAGLSLLGPTFTPGNGVSNLTVQLNGLNQEFRSDGVGVLYINANIIDPAGGMGGLLKRGTGTIALAGNNTFTGGVRVAEGILIASSDNALGDTVRGTVVDFGATMGIANGATVSDSLDLVGDGVGGLGALRGMNDPYRTFRGSTTTQLPHGTWSGGIALIGNVSIGVDVFTLGTPGTGLIVDTTGISGSGNLTKVGAGDLELEVGNTYGGNTLIRGGSVTIYDNNALSPGFSTTVFNGTTLRLDSGLAVNETLFLNGPGIFVDLAQRRLGALLLDFVGASTWLGTITLQSASNIGATQGSELLLSGALGGAADMSKTDQGNVRIARNNSATGVPTGFTPFTGNTNVNNGTLEIANALALGSSGTVTVNSTSGTDGAVGTLQIEGNYTLARPLVLNGVGFETSGAVHIIGGSAITFSGAATLGSAASLNVDGGSSLTVSGSIRDVATPPGGTIPSLEKTGTGTLTLSGNNTYLGSTSLRQGLTIIQSNQSLGGTNGAGTRVFAGATLQVANAITMTEALTLSGTGVSGTGALVVGPGNSQITGLITLLGVDATRADINVAAGGSLTFSGVVSGDADFHKIGAGELRLSGTANNTFVKPTFVDDGRLTLAKTPGLNALNGQVFVGDGTGANNSAELRLEASNQIPESVSATTIRVRVQQDGLLNLNGFNETLGAVTLAGGELTTGAGLLTLASDVLVAGAGDTAKITGNVSLGGVTRTFSVKSLAATEFFSSSAVSQFGSAVTFTVNIITGSGPAAGGSVEFFDGATSLGFGTPSFNVGVTTFTLTTSNLSAGSHTITAEYSGDAVYAGTTVALPSTQEVVGAPSRQLLTSNANQTSPGNAAFTFTITRSQASNPLPTGSVTFFATANGVTTPIGGAFLNANGVATLNSGLGAGVYVITAQYSGDAYYAPSSVTLLGGQIVVDAPSLLLTSSANSSAVGQGVTFNFTATNQFGSPVPTGTVTFFDGATIIGVAKTLVNGQATSDLISTLAAGTRVITAVYSGDPFYEAQTVVLLGGQIVVNAPVLLLSSNANPTPVGQAITFTFQVNSATATGQVNFFDAGIPLNTVPVNVVNGVATFTTNALPAGLRAITAVYSGDGGNAGGTATLGPVQVVATPLQIQLSSSASPSSTGQIVTFDFVATRQAGDPVPGGMVTFFDGATQLAAVNLTTPAGGLTSFASFSLSNLTFGTHFITARYAAGAGSAYADTTVQLRPQQAVTNPLTVQLRSSANTSLVNQSVTFTFTATRQVAANPAPTGTVTFFDNGVAMPGAIAIPLTGGVASFTTSALTQGSHTITAAYTGDTFYEGQTATVAPTQMVVATLPTPNKTVTAAQDGFLEVSGVISGSPGDGIIKDGGGELRLSGANTYSGTTTVARGTLQLTGSNTLPDGTVVALAPGTTLDLNGQSDAVASLSGSGTLVLGAGALIIGGDNSSSVFSGTITGTAGGGVGKVGTGTLTLDGPASLGYAGTTIIVGGTVFVNTDLRNAPVEVRPGATLGGTGTVGSVTVTSGGTLSPGLSPALLSINGDLTFYSSTFVVEANGTTLGSGYDSVAVSGIATLNNSATLVFSPTFSPNVGATFTILTATGGVTGTFSGLADLATFTIGTRTYQIDYTANSVLVRVLALASTATIQSNTNPSLPGQAVTYTVTIAPAAAGDAVPAGTVEFFVNGVSIGTQALAATGTLNQAAASFLTTFANAGSYTVTATFTPTPSTYEARTQTDLRLIQSVTVVSTTTLQALNGPSVFGDTVGFVARVARQTGLAVPTGTITFINSTTGEVLGVVALDATGAASLSTSTIRAGTSIISAVYSGDTFYRSGSGTASQIVDRQARLVVGTDAGPVATVQVFDPRTGALLRVLTPFDGYTLGVKVATGDVNNDGISDIIVSAGAGAPGGHVKVYSGSDYSELASFFTFIGYTGGVNVAAGDVNGDGFADIVVGTAIANDHVKAFSGRNPADTLLSFFAYSTSGGNPVGVTVGAGDVNGDGLADVITGSATFAGHVKAFSGQNNGQLLGSYFAYGAGYLGGIYVAAGDLNGDGRAEIITGATNAPHVKALDALTGAELQSFIAYPGATFGVRVGAIDRDGDGLADILTGAGGSAPHVKVFDGQTLDLLDSFLAVPVNMPPSPGIFVGGSTK
ncbi:Ig-like domain repeat protein [Gemmata sp. G18]|uniref:Ig-like domain repeat protein n=1 Tax=Gemmata palustris TaxID=2822762 RepID=A0ABS5BY44_9BACT|nr:Ig-like domain repeat protein [Gemmata palustris]MBP3958590.1 Ig-like domain repeat protein [Gemmata palustris]